MGIATLTLGITALFAWLDPFIGIPICIAGIIVGIVSLLKSQEHRRKATFGLSFSFIGLIASIIWAFFGVIALLDIMRDIYTTTAY